ncbi:hypothetical protein evm_003040 [Chilo suppressalis]|nr:hypothetical protein evm_003040 [Chilo suppressalis]
MIGAAIQEPSSVVCEVNAFPPPDTFEWTLNNSAGSTKVDPDRFTIEANEGRSVLTYTPVADVDYGTLSCRATNLAGQQVAPCVYTLLPATRPDPPTNCTVYNLTDDSIDLMCLAEAQEAWEVNWTVGIVIGAALVVAVILCLALIATRIHHRARDYEVTMPSSKNHKTVLAKRSSTHCPDDRNPDLIPLSKGLTDCAPNPPMYAAVQAPEPKISTSAHSLPRTQSPSTPVSPHAQYTDSQSDSGRSIVNGAVRSHREVVTTRTPLLAAHQESCV